MQAFANVAKAIGSLMLGIIGVAIFCLVVGLFLGGTLAISQWLDPYLFKAFTFTLIFGAILIPIALIRATRPLALIGYMIAEKLTSLCLFLHAILLTWSFWGAFAVCLGLFLAGVGIVPVAVVCMVFNREWFGLLDLIILIAFAIGFRCIVLWTAHRLDVEAESRFF
jgi:hypothetical protein